MNKFVKFATVAILAIAAYVAASAVYTVGEVCKRVLDPSRGLRADGDRRRAEEDAGEIFSSEIPSRPV